MNHCKFCDSTNVIKAGLSWNKKQVGIILEDTRIKYNENIKEMAFVLYTEGNGFRRIARILSKIFNQNNILSNCCEVAKTKTSRTKSHQQN